MPANVTATVPFPTRETPGGWRDRRAPVVRQVVGEAIDTAALDEREINRRRQELLHAFRTDVAERKR